ncbi:MAG TPA: SUMF1/EgtB/PvdO family nonheme iron enzyme [Ktedonobacterales bacterium]|nr:SUMF1/EgtB/PvdO family nonheme iron enzyme [Ktedonobacterales bacterium]
MSAYHSSFVSHAHADNDLCDRYVNALLAQARGIDIWYDRNNAQSGHFLGEQIQRELAARSAFVLLMTEASLKSFWVRLERESYLGLMASDPSRMLLAVRIGPCQPPPMVNAFIWIDALAMPFEQAIDEIDRALLLPRSAQGAQVITPPPPRATLPLLGPAPAPANSVSAYHLTPKPYYDLGYRGYSVKGVECILPPICPVPEGVFTMGSDKNRDKQAYDGETPQYLVEVDAFAIGQHPVTVAEYACAVRAKIVREPPPWEYRDSKVDWAKQQKHPDHPVVCVSWKDARVYTTWLAKLTGQPWRLPTEAEWEKAARGADGRLYPWGDTFDKARCNTSESGIGTTTAVGSYPTGESPYHVQDMTGNVWEWTSSLFQPYPYRKNDGRENLGSTENRVLRGGSWYYDSRSARVAYRGDDGWGGVVDYFGFRLSWAPAGS